MEEKMLEEIKYKLKRKLFRQMEAYDITLDYDESHILGSINVPEYQINESFEKIVPNKNKEIVVYCSSGFRSTSAYRRLRCLGYRNVWNLYGGLENY